MDEVAKKKKMPMGLSAEQKQLGGETSVEMKSVEMDTARPMSPSSMKGVIGSILDEAAGKKNVDATAVVGGKPVDFKAMTKNPSAEEAEMNRKYKESLKKIKR